MNTPKDKKPKLYTPSSAPFPYFEIAGMDEHNAQVREYARHTAQTQQNAAMINEIKAINDRLQKQIDDANKSAKSAKIQAWVSIGISILSIAVSVFLGIFL